MSRHIRSGPDLDQVKLGARASAGDLNGPTLGFVCSRLPPICRRFRQGRAAGLRHQRDRDAASDGSGANLCPGERCRARSTMAHSERSVAAIIYVIPLRCWRASVAERRPGQVSLACHRQSVTRDVIVCMAAYMDRARQQECIKAWALYARSDRRAAVSAELAAGSSYARPKNCRRLARPTVHGRCGVVP